MCMRAQRRPGGPVQTVVAAVSTWQLVGRSPRARCFDGVYTVQASQTDGIGNTGTSSPGDLHGEAPHRRCVTLTAPSRPARQPANPSRRSRVPQGTALGDLPTVAVKIYTGSTSSGTPCPDTRGYRFWWCLVGACSIPPAEGTYTAQATQGDTAGNTGASTANTFTVDTTPPKTTITSAPSGWVRPARSKSTSHPISPTARSSAVSTGRLIQRAPPPTCCASVSPGPHTFKVRAINAGGVADPATPSATWDSVAPEIDLCGSITHNETLSPEYAKIYVLNASVTVEKGVTLTAEAGYNR